MNEFNILKCGGANLRNLGGANCSQILGATKKIFFAPEKIFFADKTEITEAKFQELIQQKKLYPFPTVLDVEDNSTDAGEYTGSTGRKIKTSEAIKGERLYFDVPAYIYTRLFSFDNVDGYVFILDIKNNLLGTTSDGKKFAPFAINNLKIGAFTTAVSTTEIRRTPISFELENYEEYTKNLAVFKASFANDLASLIDVELAVDIQTTSNVTVLVTKLADESGVRGLVKDDFLITKANDDVVSITTCTEVAGMAGLYELTAALPAGSYKVRLNTPPTMTTEGYDCVNTEDFTTI